MFFCNDCKTKNNWPGLWESSYGKCEMCGKIAPCYDVPSSRLSPARTDVSGAKAVKRDA